MNYGILLGMGIGAVILYLFKGKKPNVDADNGLKADQALVDQAIADLEKGISQIKKEQRNPKEAEAYYNQGDKK